jgi:hypothetical protein
MRHAAVGFACSLLALPLPVAGRAASHRFVVLADSATAVKPTYDEEPSIDDMLRPAPDIDGVGRIAYVASIAGGGVSNAAFLRFDLNDAGEIALGAELSNARRLVVRAEPTLGCLAWRRRDDRP